jgi:hypothetical protein
MIDCWESGCLIFLGSPLIDGLEGLTTRGLYISDIPIHDATRDVILVGEQSRAQVSELKMNVAQTWNGPRILSHVPQNLETMELMNACFGKWTWILLQKITHLVSNKGMF